MDMNLKNKTLWMCWFQGEDHPSIPVLDKKCIDKWRHLNPNWKVNVLTNNTIQNYVPEYYDILKKSKHTRNHQCNSNLLRLLLLHKYGGVWADSSVYPIVSLDIFLPHVINHTNFFTYRWIPRQDRRETVSWFLAVNGHGHYLITKWLTAYTEKFINAPSDWNTGRDGYKVLDTNKYFEVHAELTKLYDTDIKVKNFIDNMVQIAATVPDTPNGDWKNRTPSYVYKRPNNPELK